MNDIVKENKKMGRKPTLSPDEIIETIKDLQNDNRDVTPCIIRRRIGFGGLGNITKVMETFLQNQTGISLSESEPKETHILPPDLEDKRNMLLTDLTLQVSNFVLESDLLANNLAEKKARSVYENIIQHNQKITDELTQTIKMFDEVEVKNDQLNEQITEIQTLFENEQVKSSALDIDLSKANDESARLNILISNIEESLSSSETKNKSLEKLITKIETRLEDAVEDKNKASNESVNLRIQLTQVNSDLKHTTESMSQLKLNIDQMKVDTKKQISELDKTNSNLMAELKACQVSELENKEQLISITSSFSAQQEIINEKEKRIMDLGHQLKELKTKN